MATGIFAPNSHLLAISRPGASNGSSVSRNSERLLLSLHATSQTGSRHSRPSADASLNIAVYPIGVPLLIFILMYLQRTEINRIQKALKENDAQQTEIISARNLAKRSSTKERRPSLVVSVDENLGWLVKKFEKFVPGRYYSGVFLLVLRILMTSVLVLIPTQNMQVTNPFFQPQQQRTSFVLVCYSYAGGRRKHHRRFRRVRAAGSAALPAKVR